MVHWWRWTSRIYTNQSSGSNNLSSRKHKIMLTRLLLWRVGRSGHLSTITGRISWRSKPPKRSRMLASLRLIRKCRGPCNTVQMQKGTIAGWACILKIWDTMVQPPSIQSKPKWCKHNNLTTGQRRTLMNQSIWMKIKPLQHIQTRCWHL